MRTDHTFPLWSCRVLFSQYTIINYHLHQKQGCLLSLGLLTLSNGEWGSSDPHLKCLCQLYIVLPQLHVILAAFAECGRLTEGKIPCSYGEVIIYAGLRLSLVQMFYSHPCFVRKPSKFIGSPNWALVDMYIVCHRCPILGVRMWTPICLSCSR